MTGVAGWLRSIVAGPRGSERHPEDVATAEEPTSDSLLSDAPLTDPEQDRLGTAPFAQARARSILGMKGFDGFVFALYGPWGSGKSTALNFVLHYVQQSATPEQVLVVQFDPWWYAGDEQLVLQFFKHLTLSLGRENVPERLRALGGKLQTFAKVVAPLTYVPVLKDWAEPINRVLQGAGQDAADAADDLAKDAESIRGEIDTLLREQQTRILVVVDDLDRLSASEIRQMFRLIKAVADFPRTTYLLAFDRSVITAALDTVQGGKGEDYLEKIVQVPLDLPPPDETALQALLFEQLDFVLGDPDPQLWDRVAWGNVFLEGIDHFIETPRDVKRFINALRAVYPAVKGEVNPIDFMPMECLRIFAPAVYHAVWDHRDLLTGSDEALGGLGAKPEDRRKQYEAILELADRSHREPVEAILTRMFPRFASALGGAQHGPEWEAQWRGKLRVCSADIFPIYFRLAVPTGGISTARMRSILALGADSEAFESALIRLAGERRPDGTSRARVFLERMEDYTADKIPADHVEPIVRAFFNAGDALVIPEDEVGFFAIGNDMRVGRIVRQLLMRLSGEEQRFQVLSRVLPGARALYTVVDRVRVFKQEHEEKGKQTPGRPEHECTVGEQHLEQLRDMALQRVQEAAAEGALAEAAHLGSVLYAWREWAGEEAPQQYAAEATSTDEGLALFLERFLRAVRSQSIEDSVGRVEWRVRPKAVGHFVEDTAGLCERASEILNVAPPWLTERQRTALSAFVDECLNPDKFRFD